MSEQVPVASKRLSVSAVLFAIIGGIEFSSFDCRPIQ